MANSEKKPGRVIFLGDIPYDLSEAQVADIARTIGPITNIRLVLDRETGRSRGFAFVEYAEINSAIQAVNVLHGQALGSRSLRVDFSNETTTNFNKSNPGQLPATNVGNTQQLLQYHNQQQQKKQQGSNRNHNNNSHNNNNSNNYHQQQQHQPTPPLPPPPPPAPSMPNQHQQNMNEVPHNLVVNDNISRTLSQFPPSQLLEVIKNMKLLTSQNPVKASEILHANFHMTYSLLQALLLMGLVDKDVVAQAVQGQPAPASSNHHNYYETPPPPPPPPPPPQGQPQVSQKVTPPLPSDPQQAAMIQQVLALTDEQINSLQPQEKNAIIAIREQYKPQ